MKAVAIALIQIERSELIADLKSFADRGEHAFTAQDVAAMRRRLSELNGVIELQPASARYQTEALLEVQ